LIIEIESKASKTTKADSGLIDLMIDQNANTGAHNETTRQGNNQMKTYLRGLSKSRKWLQKKLLIEMKYK